MPDMLWSGRFERGPHPDMVALTSSIATDMRLLGHDALATKAHARVLLDAGLLDKEDVTAIDEVLDELVEEWQLGRVVPDPGDEDVHSLVERVLTERLGDVGKRIHAGRSRNDLVATDLRLWCRDAASTMVDDLRGLLEVIAAFGDAQAETLMPGYTHVQRGQPISFGFHMLAHGFALFRDLERFRHAYDSSDVSALGAGALAGNTLGLDATVAADELRFSAVFDNAMDAVSDRDFAADLLYACAMCSVHLSRLAEELVLWSSAEFGFVRIADDWSTGSSMMPQKRNPDLAELIRGRAAGAVSDLNGLLVLLKGLPLAYDRDLQEDKEFLFRSFDRTSGVVRGMTGMLGAIRLDKDRLAAAAAGGASWATDLAEALVGRGVPFRVAHDVAGKLVATLEQRGLGLADVDLDLLRGHHELFAEEDLAFADPVKSLSARASRGGTSPAEVRAQAERLRAALASL
jgi:argininosuccinate lyase